MADIAEFKKDAAEKPKGFPALLDAYKPQIAAALPRHLNADRMARIALTCYRMTPKLSECDPLSIFAAVIQAAQLGLEPGLNGRAYIIPYGNQATFIPGWKGLVELANRSGRVAVWTGAIFRDQKYEYADGSVRQLKILNETELADPADMTHAYAVGLVKGMESHPYIELWRTAKIEKHRNRYNKVGKRHYSYEHMEMYSRKVVLLQVLKYLPSTPELEAAIILNDSAEMGGQNLTIKDAIDGTFTPVHDQPPPAAAEAGATSSAPAERSPAAQSGGDQQSMSDPEQVFAAADDAVRAKDWDLARDLARSLPEGKRKLIEERIPKGGK